MQHENFTKIFSNLNLSRSDSLVLAKTLSLFRNCKHELFPIKQPAEKASEFLKKIEELIYSKYPTALKLYFSQLSPDEKNLLFKKTYFDHQFEDRPFQEVFYIDCKDLFIFINFENHLSIHYVEKQMSLELMLDEVFEVERFFAKHLDFAFSDKFGFITCQDKHLGHGLLIKSYLHLPLISFMLNQDKKIDLEQRFSKLSYFEQFEQFAGVMTHENSFNLGISAFEILESLNQELQKILDYEKKLRNLISDEKLNYFKEKISRSYGTILHGYHLQEKELLSALSMIKLGINFNLLDNLDDSVISELLLNYHSLKSSGFVKENVQKGTLKF